MTRFTTLLVVTLLLCALPSVARPQASAPIVGVAQIGAEQWVILRNGDLYGRNESAQDPRWVFIGNMLGDRPADHVAGMAGAYYGSPWLIYVTNTGYVCTVEGAQVVSGQRYGYRLGVQAGASQVFMGEVWVAIPVRIFALDRIAPNPTRGTAVRVSFSLPSAQPAKLELFDLGGRRLIEREVGSLGLGQHVVDLAENRRLPAGVCFLRLTQGASVATARLTLLE